MSRLFSESIKNNVNGYKVILSYDVYDEEQKDIVTRYAELDVQDGAKEVTSNVEMTSFPTMNGHHIADHIYRLPIEIGLKGMFSDDGLKAMNWIGVDRLATIQAEFEACQRAGVKFRVVTIRGDNANSSDNRKFLARNNMVLTSIRWSEDQNVMGFNFTFKEALSSNIYMADAKTDISDPNLPAITDLDAASLVGELINSDDVITMTIETLKDLELVNDATFNKCMALGMAGVAAELLVGAAVVGMVFLCIAAGAAAVPFAGWVVAAACAIAAGICAIFSFIGAAERAKKIEYYKSLGHVFLIEEGMSEKEQEEIARAFVEFLVKVKTEVDTSLSDISVYRIAKTDRQECILMLNGNYYVQRIERNNDDQSYWIECLHNGDKTVVAKSKIIGLESFADCDNSASSVFFRDVEDARYRAYIINRASYMQSMKGEKTTSDELLDDYTSDVAKYEASKDELLDFAFVTAPYPLTDLTDRIAEVISNTIGKY